MTRKQGGKSRLQMKPVTPRRTGASTDRPLTKREAAQCREDVKTRPLLPV